MFSSAHCLIEIKLDLDGQLLEIVQKVVRESKLLEKFEKLEKAGGKSNSAPMTTTTAAQFYQAKVDNGEVCFKDTFQDELKAIAGELSEDQLSSSFDSTVSFPPTISGEKTKLTERDSALSAMTKQDLLNLLQPPSSCANRLPTSPWQLSSQDFVTRTMVLLEMGAMFTKNKSKRNAVSLSVSMDHLAYLHPSVGGRKPDGVWYTPGMRGEHEIVLVYDVKAPASDGNFSNDSKGRLLDFAQCLLRQQHPMRAGMIAFLTDGHSFQFFRILRAGENYRVEYTDLFLGHCGWKVIVPFFWILTSLSLSLCLCLSLGRLWLP
jgi:hypothetical protein